MKNSKSGQKPSQNKASNLGGGYNWIPVRLLNKFAKRHPLAPCGRGQKIDLSHAKIRFSGEGLKHKEHVINKTILRFVPQNDSMFLPDMDSAERNFRWTFRERLLGGVSSRRVKNSDKGCQHLQDYHSKAGLLRHQSSDASQRQHLSLALLADLHSAEQNFSVNDFARGLIEGEKGEQFKKFLLLTLFSNLRQNLRLKTGLSLKGRGVKTAAFTLAEVLITLLIIGIVAAMTLPNFIHNITERSNATKVAVFNSKFIAGLNSAKAQGDMGNQFKDTYDFLQNGLSHHLKMIKICDNSNLEECFNYKDNLMTYDNSKGKEKTVKVSNLKTAKDLHLNKDTFSDTAAFIMGDGTPVLLTYDTKCTNDGGADKSISPCVAGLFDINGSKKPNLFLNKVTDGKSELGDIRSFNDASLNGCVGFLNDVCIASNVKIGNDTSYDDMLKAVKDKDPAYTIPKITWGYNDYWDVAKNYCENVVGGNLPSQEELNQIASALYGKPITGDQYRLKMNDDVYTMLGFTGNPSGFSLWADTKNGDRACSRSFDADRSFSYCSLQRYYKFSVICTN